MQRNGRLGSQIREARKAKKLTQGQLAKACGLATSEVSELETGARRHFVLAHTAVKMARKLGLHPLVLLRLGRADYAVWRAAFGVDPMPYEAKERPE